MVATNDMRMFALDCSRWAEQASNPSARQTILSVGRRWMSTATSIERHLDADSELVCPDFKRKLD
jgi:hypothetical protein